MDTGLTINNRSAAVVTPKLTQEEAVSIAREALKARKLDFDTAKGFWPVFQGLRETRDGITTPIWSVAFATSARQVPFRGKIVEVAEKDYYACVSDETKEFLYIIHSTGYIE